MSDPVILRSPNLGAEERPIVVRLYETARPSQFKNGGLARAASVVRSAGRGGDDILLHINPQEFEFLRHAWGEPSTNAHTGLPEYGLFSKIKKALKFEAFNVKKIVKGVVKNPTRLLTGVDPIMTKATNKLFGLHNKPLVNQLGGATQDTFNEAKAKGMDTGLAKTLHGVAGAIAGFYGGNALGKLAGTGLEHASWALKGGDAARASQLANAAQGLQDVVPTVSKIGQGAVPGTVEAVSQPLTEAALQEITPSVSKLVAENTSPLTSALDTGARTLGDLKGSALDYAKDPKNFGTIMKGVGALGLLGGSGSTDQATPPNMPQSPGLKQLPFNRQRTDPNMDWYTYGQGPEASFYTDNTVPAFTPDEPEPKGSKHGGLNTASRFVRGPGTGRSDSIDARLSDGEYVLTAEDVALLGDGSSEAGAKRLDEFRQNLRRHKGTALARGKISPNAKSPMAYLKGKR